MKKSENVLEKLDTEEARNLLLLQAELEKREMLTLTQNLQTSSMVSTTPKPEDVARMAWLTQENDIGDRLYPADHHWVWLKLLCNPEIKRLLIIAPPESAKTTWNLAYLATSLAFDPVPPRIIAGVTDTVAEKRSLSLRNLVTTPQFKAIWPDLKPVRTMRWATNEWTVAPDGKPLPGRIHPSYFAAGVGGSVIGARAKEILADDVLDFDNTRTAHIRGLVSDWFWTSLYSRLMSRIGRILVVGTSWHHADLYSEIKKQSGWVTCHLPLLAEGPEVYAIINYPDDFEGDKIGDPVSEASLREVQAEVQKLEKETNA